MCKVRLYLTSRCKPVLSSECNQSDIGKPAEGGCSPDDEADLRPMLITENQFVHTWHDTLIGSSEQHDIIKSEQDNAYLASLAKDEADDEARREAMEHDLMEWQRQESLRQARGLRVPNEPNPPCITVQVRHPTMGHWRRGLSSSDTMMAVYDWVGSQTTEPEYFELRSNSVKCLPPTTPVTEVDRQTLYMAECEVPPSICDEAEDKTVEFRGLVNCLTAVQRQKTLWRWNALVKRFQSNSWMEILPVESTTLMILLPCKYVSASIPSIKHLIKLLNKSW